MTVRLARCGLLGYVRTRRRIVAWEWYGRHVPGLAWEVARHVDWRYRVWLGSIFVAWRRT